MIVIKDIELKLNEKKAKQLHFVLKFDLIGGLLPLDMVDTIHELKTELEQKLGKEIKDEP